MSLIDALVSSFVFFFFFLSKKGETHARAFRQRVRHAKVSEVELKNTSSRYFGSSPSEDLLPPFPELTTAKLKMWGA